MSIFTVLMRQKSVSVLELKTLNFKHSNPKQKMYRVQYST